MINVTFMKTDLSKVRLFVMLDIFSFLSKACQTLALICIKEGSLPNTK